MVRKSQFSWIQKLSLTFLLIATVLISAMATSHRLNHRESAHHESSNKILVSDDEDYNFSKEQVAQDNLAKM